jgi:hypothetical protein
MKTKILLDFATYSDTEFGALAAKVLSGLTKNPAFPNPIPSVPDLGKLVSSFNASVLAALQGGLQLTAAKNTARRALDEALRQEAHYVESMACKSDDTLLSSGFYVVTVGKRGVPGPLPKPIVTLVDMGAASLRVKLGRMPGAKSYQLQFNSNGTATGSVNGTANGNATGNDAWQDAGMYTRMRDMVLQQLVPGTVYQVRVRAFGGRTGQSEWSEPVAKKAT